MRLITTLCLPTRCSLFYSAVSQHSSNTFSPHVVLRYTRFFQMSSARTISQLLVVLALVACFHSDSVMGRRRPPHGGSSPFDPEIGNEGAMWFCEYDGYVASSPASQEDALQAVCYMASFGLDLGPCKHAWLPGCWLNNAQAFINQCVNNARPSCHTI